MTAHMDDLRSVLNQPLLQDIRKRHGITSFLPQQPEVVSCLLDDRRERNVLYMAPAARGKTLPPLIAALEHRRQRPRRMTLWFVPVKTKSSSDSSTRAE
jgi:replicative superfamily II helicase